MKCERCGQTIEPEVIPPRGRTGRPSEYDPEAAQAVCERIARGEPLIKICEDDGMPNYWAVKGWMREGNAAFAHFMPMYAQARAESADWLFDQMMIVAMKTEDDWEQDPETGTFRPNHYTVGRAKLILEQMRWNASKLRPQSYGDRIEALISGQIEHKHAHVHIDASKIPAEQREQLRGTLLQIVGRRGGGDGGGRDDEG